MPRPPSIKAIRREGDDWAVRLREPDRFTAVSSPAWAARVAQAAWAETGGNPDGIRVRRGRLRRTGSWKVFEVVVPARRGRGRAALRSGTRRVVRRLEGVDL